MITNLVGNIASGKSLLAKWLVGRHEGWVHLDIAERRKWAAGFMKDLSMAEELAWGSLHETCQLSQDKHIVLESTGLSPGLGRLWNKLKDRGIYTVAMECPKEECKKRARERVEEVIPGYDLDECYAIDLEDEIQAQLPVNLIVRTNCPKEELNSVFQEAEQYILKAKRYLDIRFCKEKPLYP